jgi:hypothetical protein
MVLSSNKRSVNVDVSCKARLHAVLQAGGNENRKTGKHSRDNSSIFLIRRAKGLLCPNNEGGEILYLKALL